MRVIYQERIDTDSVICNVRWDGPGGQVFVNVRVEASLDEVPVPEPIAGAPGIKQDIFIPTEIKIRAAQQAQRLATAFSILELVDRED